MKKTQPTTPTISFDSIRYDSSHASFVKSTNKANETSTTDINTTSSSSSSSNIDTPKPFGSSRPHLVINNSIDSQQIDYPQRKDYYDNAEKNETIQNMRSEMEKAELEISMFNSDNTLMDVNKMGDYNAFKMPLMPPPNSQSSNYLPLSLQPINTQPAEFLFKKNKVE